MVIRWARRKPSLVPRGLFARTHPHQHLHIRSRTRNYGIVPRRDLHSAITVLITAKAELSGRGLLGSLINGLPSGRDVLTAPAVVWQALRSMTATSTKTPPD